MESEILVTLDNYKKLIGKKVVLVHCEGKSKSSEMEQTEGEGSNGIPQEGKGSEKYTGVLYILTSVWVLHTLKASPNMFLVVYSGNFSAFHVVFLPLNFILRNNMFSVIKFNSKF